MVKSAKTTSSKKHEDRQLAAKTAFESTKVEIQTPQTMILLLASKEDAVILKALSTLDKFASKLDQNSLVLYEEGILKLLIPLLNYPDLYIKRFAIKLLSEMSFQLPVVESLLEKELVPTIVELLNIEDDLVVKEFSSSVIAEITKTKAGFNQFVDLNLFSILIPLLSTSDPDIQKNSLQIIYNFIQDPYTHSLLIEEPDFKIKVFLDLLMSDYVAIQNLSLDVLNLLTSRRKTNDIPKQFQDSGGVTKLLVILKNFEWKDIHSKCLNILENIYENPNIAQHFIKDGVLQLFSYIDFMNDPQLRSQAVEVMAKITQTPQGRKVLAESGQVAHLVGMLLEQSLGMTAAACHSVSGLVQDYSALQEMLSLNIVTDLLVVICDQNRSWNDKTAALSALNQILVRDVNSCKMVIDSNKKDVFEIILGQFDDSVPVLAAVAANSCITVIARDADLRQRIATSNLISSLLGCFQDFKEDTTVLKTSACEALCSLLSECETRKHLQALDGLSVVWKSITKHPNNVHFLQSAAKFVHVCVDNDANFTNTLLQLDALNWLLSQKSLRLECPDWEVTLETIFKKFLPIKFAFYGRLDLTDVTENNFYITKVGLSREELNENQFPILNNIISDDCCPIQTLYIANFDGVTSCSSHDSISSSIRQRKLTERRSFERKSIERNLSVGSNSKGSIQSLTISNKSQHFLSGDFYLQKYLILLKEIIDQRGFIEENQKDSVVDGDTVRGKALLIGQFVANEMSGSDKTGSCTAHLVDLHINELKVEMMNSIIPVGWLRVGLHLERAFLFKVLADRLGLPTSLVRGEYGQRAWVEVAIPNIPPAPRPSYPNRLLKPTHVVDLIYSPGTLYPLHSYEANVYCGFVQ